MFHAVQKNKWRNAIVGLNIVENKKKTYRENQSNIHNRTNSTVRARKHNRRICAVSTIVIAQERFSENLLFVIEGC